MGGVGVTGRIAEALAGLGSPWMHAYTYSAHPVGCAVALSNLEILEREGLPAQAASKGDYLLAGLRAELAGHPHVGEVRGMGLMCAVEYVKDKSTKEEFEPRQQVGQKVNAEAERRGLFSRVRGDVFFLAPPFITSRKQLDRGVQILAESTKAVLG